MLVKSSRFCDMVSDEIHPQPVMKQTFIRRINDQQMQQIKV